MKRLILPAVVLLAGLASCNSNKTSDKTTDSASKVIAVDTTFAVTNPPDKKSADCYAYIKNRDTAMLKLNTAGEEVTGDLSYNLFEKDKNKGTITGEIKKDTVIAEYTFDSEGLRSVREIVFLKKDGKLYEGFGETEDKKGKTVFKNRAALKFTDAMVFSKTDCK